MKFIDVKEMDGLGTLPQEVLDGFIYIIGSARGGTSILREAIGVHDQILALPGMTHFMNQVWRYRKRVHLRLLKQIFRLPGFYHETEVIRALGGEKGRKLQRYIGESFASLDLRRMWQIYPLVYALDEENPKRPEGVLRWADKANDFYRVKDVANAFPNARFVFIVRDPRGSVSSLAKRMAVKEEYNFQARLDNAKLIEAAISWRRMTQRVLLFAKRNTERSKVIRLEDLLTAQCETLNDIFRFVGVSPMAEDVLQTRLDHLSYGSSNHPDQAGTGIQREPMDRWKKVLTEEQVGIIHRLTTVTALKAGYRIERPSDEMKIDAILEMIPSTWGKAIALSKVAYLQVVESLL
jgi:hypothetical protein